MVTEIPTYSKVALCNWAQVPLCALPIVKYCIINAAKYFFSFFLLASDPLVIPHPPPPWVSHLPLLPQASCPITPRMPLLCTPPTILDSKHSRTSLYDDLSRSNSHLSMTLNFSLITTFLLLALSYIVKFR